MADSVESARSNLAFLREVSEDRGPLPSIVGAHMVVVGVIFAADLVLAWAVQSGLVGWPAEWTGFLWLPGVAIYAPVLIYFARRSRGAASGPATQVFAAAWSMAGAMTAATVLVFLIATLAGGEPFLLLWPAMAFVLYGGAWLLVAIVRRRWWIGAVAFGSFAWAALCAATLKSQGVWLIEAAGLALLLSIPGAVIIWKAREPA